MATLYGRQEGIPGVQQDTAMTPELTSMLLQGTQQMIGEKEVSEAISTLAQYKQGKGNLENRIVNDEMWWELRHWESIKGKKKAEELTTPEPSSAWLFNAILNKHADAMDNYPEPVALPREKSDTESAKVLSSVLPVVMEYNDFEQVYSNNWWEKLKHGTAVYGVFWNTKKENGLGDIDIRQLDLLQIFWEPGITDIQNSRNLFIVDLVDEDILNDQYPQFHGKLSGNTVDVKQYIYDDTVDTSNKSVVVDWYYKRMSPDGRTILQYAKFVGNTLLYASENDPEYQQRGYYDHGMYPVVFDCLFPEKGTPVGFGYVAICKDPQLYIDKLNANILENAMMNTKKRFFMSSSTNVNEEEFLDWNKPIVHVEGELNDTRIKEIVCNPLSATYLNVVQMKIEEMKDTAGNRDVNSGQAGGGVTSGAAIAALQEAGNKTSRDMIAASYRAYININQLVIELMRQFYDEARSFRITGTTPGEYQFIDMDNSRIKDQQIGMDATGNPLFRRPVFDLKIKAQKQNPFSRMEINEYAKELYRLGFFNAEKAQEASIAIGMMEFEGVEQVREQIAQGQTLLNICQQLMQENTMLKAVMGGLNAPQMPLPQGGTPQGAQSESASAELASPSNGNTTAGRVMASRQPQKGYTQRLVEKGKADMANAKNNAMPGAR